MTTLNSKALLGKRALVTGAASGIGLAVAEELTARGASLVVSDIAGPALDALAERLSAVTIAADLACRDDVDALAARAGHVDILINNAGLQHVSPIESFDPLMWDKLIAVMLTAPFLLMRALVPGMYERSWGRVVNVASVHGLVASPFKSAYVTAKHGILGLTKTVALEAAARCPGVTVNAICPSYVRTPLVERQIAAQAKAHGIEEHEVVSRVLLTQNAVKRLIEPHEVAKSVVYLCQDESWSVTGSALTMDAGWLAH
jgi:3-hydroxybutyrate dehydrogenase